MKKHLAALLAASVMTANAYAGLSENSTVRDLLNTPAFQGFAERILPWDDRPAPRDLPLGRLGELMPYHSNMIAAEMVATLNKMARSQQQDGRIFYEIYSDEEKRQDPTKRHSGLFFFKGKAGSPFAMIAAGGGFAYVGSLHEGFPIAAAVADLGYNAFVVKYRVGQGGRTATEDMAQAVEFVRKNAKMLGVNPNGYSVWGGSAGARMAASIGSYGTKAFGTQSDSYPNAVVMLYTGHSDYNQKRETPTFAAVGEYDGIASPSVMKRRIDTLQKMGVAAEFRLYPKVGHGFALGTGTAAQGWVRAAVTFWQHQVEQNHLK